MPLFGSLLAALGRLFGRSPQADTPNVAPRKSPPAAAPTAPSTGASTSPARKRIIKITPAAARNIAQVMSRQPHRYLRISGDPASGAFGYRMNFVESADPTTDFIDECEGITVVVERKQAKFLHGTTLDYKTTPTGAKGLHFDNPNELSG